MQITNNGEGLFLHPKIIIKEKSTTNISNKAMKISCGGVGC